MRKIIIICSVLISIIVIIAIKYFAQLAGKDNNVAKCISFIPSDAALILNFDNDESFYEIFKDYQLFDAIVGKQRSLEIEQVRQFTQQPRLKEITLDKKVYISFHPIADSIDFLFTMNLDSKFSTEHLQELLIKTPGISLQINSDFVYKFTNSSITEALYIYLEKGVVIASFSKDLLAKSITKNKVALDKNLIEEINKTSNKSQSSPINLFLNHKATTPFLAQIIKKEKLGALAMLDGINGSSTLSMNFKSDALIFNGISTTDTSTLNYFNIFLHQKSAANALKNVVPKNTANFLAFGLSDIKIFQKDLTTYLKKAAVLDKLEAQIKDVEINSGIDLKRDLKPQWDKEFILINNSYGEKFAIIKVKDGRKTNFTLQLISRPINESISQLNYSNLFYYFFGEPLKSFSKPYFAIADNYLIISNTPGVIKNYLFEYENEQFLSSTNEFKKYDQLLANQSNVFYFLHTKNSQRQFKSILKPQNAALFSDKNYGLKDFYALSYQWSGDKDHFYTNLYLSQPALDTTSIKTVKE